jgi:hypothetical protein
VVHVPGPTIVPFVMSLGFVGLFAAALIDSTALAVLGGAITLGALVGWFWPQRSERLALDELGAPESGRLPLATAGPLSNGWWATLVLLAVLATALVTLVASYVYLGNGTLAWAPTTPALTRALIATALSVLSGFAMLAATLSTGVWTRRLALGGAAVLSLAFIVVSIVAYLTIGHPARESAYGSIVLGLFGYQWLVVVLAVAMLVTGQLWSWLAPDDPRGAAVVLNTGLVVGFSLLSWLVVFAMIYLTPRLG